MPWLRLWTDILDSEKIAKLDDSTYRGWTLILLAAKRHGNSGELPPVDRLAYWVRSTEAIVRAWIDTLVRAGFLDRSKGVISVHDWDRWQPERDSTGASRQRAWRERNPRKKGVPAPPQKTEEETDTDTDPEGHSYAPPLRNTRNDVTQGGGAVISTMERPEDPDLDRTCNVASEVAGDISWAIWCKQQYRMGSTVAELQEAIETCVNNKKMDLRFAAGVLRRLANERAKLNGKAH